MTYITSWDDDDADLRRERERDARDDESARCPCGDMGVADCAGECGRMSRDTASFPHNGTSREQVAWLMNYAERHGLSYDEVETYFRG